MKIPSPPDRDAHIESLRSDLSALLEQPRANEVRPCGDCDVRCGCGAYSEICCCECSESCKNAPARLSSDGVRYPIELRVLPLVYGLATMRVVTPCWSCQGHPAADGGGVKAPQVWFYSRSLGHVHLIGQYLAQAFASKQLNHEWQVRSGPYAERCVPIFIIEPRMTPEEISQRDALNALQHDLHSLGTGFEQHIREFAKRELERIEPSPARRSA